MNHSIKFCDRTRVLLEDGQKLDQDLKEKILTYISKYRVVAADKLSVAFGDDEVYLVTPDGYERCENYSSDPFYLVSSVIASKVGHVLESSSFNPFSDGVPLQSTMLCSWNYDRQVLFALSSGKSFDFVMFEEPDENGDYLSRVWY